MTIYTHANAQAPNQRTSLSAGQPVTCHARFILGPTLLVGDVLQLFRVPALSRIRGALLFAQKLDTGGAPAIAFSVGDGVGAAHIFAAQTIGQNGGQAEIAVGAAPKGYQFPSDDIVTATITAAAQTQAVGAYFDLYLDLYE